MIRLIDVYEDWPSALGPNPSEKILYDLLEERDPNANISHKEMPTMSEHEAFVRRMPYRAWYLIQTWPTSFREFVGAIYLTNQREIGIGIFKKYQGQGHGTAAVRQLMELHPGKFYANISPHNPNSVKLFKRFGAKLIQNTFELES